MADPSDCEAGRRLSRKENLIQIRMSVETRALLYRAAALSGQTLPEFILNSACRQAEESFLDHRVAPLGPEVFNAFLARLDAPADPASLFVDLMRHKAPWDT